MSGEKSSLVGVADGGFDTAAWRQSLGYRVRMRRPKQAADAIRVMYIYYWRFTLIIREIYKRCD